MKRTSAASRSLALTGDAFRWSTLGRKIRRTVPSGKRSTVSLPGIFAIEANSSMCQCRNCPPGRAVERRIHECNSRDQAKDAKLKEYIITVFIYLVRVQGAEMGQKDKTGRSYENLAQVIFQSITRQNVERNVILRGKTISHQIDIYWKFEVGGVQYETIVEAKDWNKPVDQSQLLAFKAILDDLPGQPKGIFVTRNGYQAGAEEFAIAQGILIYELKEFDTFPPLEATVGSWVKISNVRVPLRGVVKRSEEHTSELQSLRHLVCRLLLE